MTILYLLIKNTKICKGDVVCSDFDIDGDIDILLTGETDNNKIFSGIYSNINKNTLNILNRVFYL